MASCELRIQGSGGLARRLRVARGSTLLEAATSLGLPLARACGGQGLCGRCGLWILRGGDSLSPETAEERDAKQRNRVDPRQRLACCTRLDGPATISAGYW